MHFVQQVLHFLSSHREDIGRLIFAAVAPWVFLYAVTKVFVIDLLPRDTGKK